MAEFLILKQKVYHDGRSMIVVKPGDEHEVPEALVVEWDLLGVIDAEKPIVGAAAFKIEPHGIGRYKITGPGMSEPEIIKGKAAAESRLVELKIAAADPAGNDAPPV